MEPHTQFRTLLGKAAGAELYRNNPFRRLGLSVLAPPREVAKRCDQLKLSTELGISDSKRAFAPAHPPSVDQVRESAQQLQDPALRLIHEFFWFWPVQYPENGDDPGLVALEKGDPEEAFACWCRALAAGEPAALHNMAVYFHLIALNWELDDARSQRTDDEIWGPALKYWKRVLTGDGIWERLRKRTQGQVDAASLGRFVDDLREQLPATLAAINAQWARQCAEKGLFERATQHSAMVLALHADEAEGRKMLEACTASSVRRIEARVAECRRIAEATPESSLPAVLSLLADCESEIRVIEGFCGAGTPRTRELCQPITAASLDALVAYQRKTQDNRGSLPLFLHLLDKPATPELLKRASDAFEVVYANAIAAERNGDQESSPVAACRLLVGCLLPSVRLLNFSPAARAPYRARIGALLLRISEETAANPLASNVGSKALCAAAALLTPRTASQPAPAPLQIQTSACSLVIGSEGITLNGNRVALTDLVGLRYGLPAPATPGAASVPIIAWSSFTEAWEVDFSALGVPALEILPLYTAAAIALEYYVRPALASTLLGWLRSGEDVMIGELRLHKSGLKPAAPSAPPAPLADQVSDPSTEAIPFAQLLAGQDAASLHLSSRPPRTFSTTLDCAFTWNAAIIAQVIDTLAGDVETSPR